MGLTEGEESKQGIQNLFEEIITKNFPNLVKEKETQVHEAQRKWTQRGPYQDTSQLKWQGLKTRKNSKSHKEMQVVTYKGAPIRLSSDFSTETFQARRDWHEMVKVIKSKGLQPRLFYPAQLTFKI